MGESSCRKPVMNASINRLNTKRISGVQNNRKRKGKVMKKFMGNVNGLSVYAQRNRIIIESSDGSTMSVMESDLGGMVGSFGTIIPQSVDIRWKDGQKVEDSGVSGFRLKFHGRDNS